MPKLYKGADAHIGLHEVARVETGPSQCWIGHSLESGTWIPKTHSRGRSSAWSLRKAVLCLTSCRAITLNFGTMTTSLSWPSSHASPTRSARLTPKPVESLSQNVGRGHRTDNLSALMTLPFD